MPSTSGWTDFERASFTLDLIAAAGTLIAVVVALVFGVHEVRRFRREQLDRDAALRRAQAEQIGGWLKHQLDQYSEPPRFYTTGEVSNPSGSPIYEAMIHVPHDDPRHGDRSIGFVPPGQTGHCHFGPIDGPVDTYAPVDIAFRDAGERWWMRDRDGHLTRWTSHPWASDDPQPVESIRPGSEDRRPRTGWIGRLRRRRRGEQVSDA